MTIQTLSAFGVDVFRVGVSNGKKVYRHVPTADFTSVESALSDHATYGAHRLDSGEWTFGWIFKVDPSQPRAMLQAIQVQSDTTNDIYTVTVDMGTGEPVSCTCPAGQRGVLCKHLYRGQVWIMGTLQAAGRSLVENGKVKDSKAFWEHFNRVVEQTTMNTAIERAIAKGLGNDHPHAEDWKTVAYRRRRQQGK